jgi:tetratricopeptide (TPR) repeat protein
VSVTPPSPPASIEAWEVLDLLTALVQKSLVVYEEDEQGRGRYRLLETVRQYARDRLLESGEAAVMPGRHRDWFLALAEEAEPGLAGESQRTRLDRLEVEHDNLRAALAWSGAQGEGEVGLRLGEAVRWLWEMRGYWTEGREQLARLLALPGAQARTAVRAKALYGAGLLAWLQGDSGAARALYEESLTIFRELGDQKGIAWSLHGLGWTAHDQGDSGATRALYEESLAIFRELGNKKGIAISLLRLERAAKDQGDSGAARALSEESLAIFRELGGRSRGIFQNLEELAAVAVAQGQPERAARLFGAAEGLREALGAPLPPVDRAEHDRSVAAVRTALGEEAFTAAWAEGRAMSLDEAVAYALKTEGEGAPSPEAGTGPPKVGEEPVPGAPG